MQDINGNASNWWFLLGVRRLPARLTAEQVARLGGFQTHDIPTLVRLKLLQPLGNGAKNSVKYFASEEILEKTSDRKWLDRATKAVSRCKRTTEATEASAEKAAKELYGRS
jgi:hypothetical protein